MAFGGYGVAHTEGKVVFLPFSIEGEKVKAEIVQEKKTYSLGRVRDVMTPSPWRVKPPCPYFGVCGGCQWQHISPLAHGRLKREILENVLGRIGGLKEIPAILVIPFDTPYGYRIRVQLKIRAGRIGYYQERSHQVVDIDRCAISHPLINRLLLVLRNELPSLSPIEEAEINVSPEEGKGVVVLHARGSGPKKILSPGRFARLLEICPDLKGMALRSGKRVRLFGDPFLNFTIRSDRFGSREGLRLRVSPESFFQVHPEQNRRLIETVLDFSEAAKDEKVLDLYSGIGNLTLPLALRAGEVAAVEESRSAVEDGRYNADENGLACHFVPGKVEEALRDWEGEGPDLIVLDPPRSGCRSILDRVARLKPAKIVYVSCEPTTFSRDVKALGERGFRLRRLALIDMFPQTHHMEVVGLLK